MNTIQRYDVIFLGQMMKDRIILQNETITATGGAAYYSGAVVQRLGLQTAVITKLAKSDSEMLDEFREIGIDVFPVYDAVTSSIELTYPTAQPDKRTARFPSVASPFALSDIPEVTAKILHLCPLLRGEISLEMVKMCRERTERLSLDAQGFMRGATEYGDMLLSDWEEKVEGLQSIDILKVDDVEAEILTGTNQILDAAEKLASYGPKEIVITHKDGVMVYVDGNCYKSPFTSRNFKGRTGRGDTTMGAYLAYRLSHSPEESCRFASALTSLKMEEHGPFHRTLQDVEHVLRERYAKCC